MSPGIWHDGARLETQRPSQPERYREWLPPPPQTVTSFLCACSKYVRCTNIRWQFQLAILNIFTTQSRTSHHTQTVDTVNDSGQPTTTTDTQRILWTQQSESRTRTSLRCVVRDTLGTHINPLAFLYAFKMRDLMLFKQTVHRWTDKSLALRPGFILWRLFFWFV